MPPSSPAKGPDEKHQGENGESKNKHGLWEVADTVHLRDPCIFKVLVFVLECISLCSGNTG